MFDKATAAMTAEFERLMAHVAALEKKYDHAYDGWERECETANALRDELAKLRQEQRLHAVIAGSMLSAAPPTVPQGWQLVPVEPTSAMFAAGSALSNYGIPNNIYKAMLAVAPACPDKATPAVASASQDAERYQWLMGDCDGNDQDDIIRWLSGTVASKEEIDAKIDAARLNKETK